MTRAAPDPGSRALRADPAVRLIVSGYLLFLFAKLWLIAHSDLFGDEAFYWQCAQRMALIFSDHPFLTALLVKGGTWLAGDSLFGLRILFLVAGSLLPFAVYWLARPLVGVRDAVLAAGATLLLPFAAGAGLVAAPDFPLQLLAVLSIAAFERATRTGCLRYWLLTGLLGALGLWVHYRFVLFPAGAFLYLVATPQGRAQWREPGFWLCAALLLAGFLLVILATLGSGLHSLHYQFVDRHPWRFQAIGLLHPVIQALATTPLLYAALLITLARAVQRAWQGDDRLALIACIAGLHTAVYWLLAPWADNDHMSRHWPVPGYLPLLALLPQTLRGADGWVRARYGENSRRFVQWAVPATALAGSLWIILKLSLTVYAAGSGHMLPHNLVNARMLGWQPLIAYTHSAIATGRPGLVLADDYYAGAAIEFGTGRLDQVFLMEGDYVRKHGRAPQYELWRLNDTWLRRRHPGEAALVVVHQATSSDKNRIAMTQLCRMFDVLRPAGQLRQADGKLQFAFFEGRNIRPPGDDNRDLSRCPTPAHVILDEPIDGARITGRTLFRGWALNNIGGIRRIELLLDGLPVAEARYGLARSDVFQAYPASTDPNRPQVGFEILWDARIASPGWHRMALRVSSANGVVEEYEPRRILISPQD
jgi:4-amino-4-deoxy-L-arabinose transferase-like glycosyltransferase